MNYVIVVPAKDEELNIEYTLKSICNQTILPKICVIIDDNSTDNTSGIVNYYAHNYEFIRYYEYIKTKKYRLGSRVVEIFNFGKQIIDQLSIKYDYIVKLDADVSFSNDFFEQISKETINKQLGIFSGTPYFIKNNHKYIENNPAWHSRGQFKIYKTECLSQIVGLSKSLGWDCADNIKAIELGWKTAAFPTIYYRIHRRIGHKYSHYKGKANHGLGAYYLGYSFPYFILRILVHIFKPPYIIGAWFMFVGYLQGVFSFKKRILNPTQVSLLRKMLWNSLFQRLKTRMHLNSLFSICK